MVVYDADSKIYHFGSKIWELSMTYYHRIHLVPVAWPYLQRLRDKFDQTVQLGILDGTEILYVAKVESSRPLQLVSHVGSRLPAYATGLGKALLATRDAKTLESEWKHVKYQRFTENTLSSFEDLLRNIAISREQGFAVDMGEYSADVRCLAYPILGFQNRGMGALSVSLPVEFFTPTLLNELSGELQHIGHLIATQVGSAEPDAWRKLPSLSLPVRANLL
ncbi:MAG: IclR family transcriptional regulator [Firmicutes bacterium]|nr:IclR family transcriptional regulator [Bacillota bacterium]